MRGSGLFVVMMLLFVQLAACSNSDKAGGSGDTAATKPEPAQDPVTLTMQNPNASYTEADLKQLYIDPVQKKFPFITLNVLKDNPGLTLEDQVASKSLPDILYVDANEISDYEAIHAIIDLAPLIKKHNYNLDLLEPDMIKAIKDYGKTNEMYAIPFIGSGAALFYNKDMFDKFGVSYPKDGMTWDDVIALADQMGRKSEEKQFKFLDPGTIDKFSGSLAPGFIDPKTNKATLTTEKWQRIFTLYKQIRTLPNNDNITKAKNMFTKDKTLAMYAYVNNVAQYVPLIKEGLNWDMASYPSFKEAPGKGLEFSSHDMMISSTSKFPDAAFLAITALTGDEAQMQVSERAMIPAAKDEKFKKAFATSFPELKQHNINVQALFKVSPVILPPATEAITAVKAQVENAMNSVLAGSDINTALRTAEEAANQSIAAIGSK